MSKHTSKQPSTAELRRVVHWLFAGGQSWQLTAGGQQQGNSHIAEKTRVKEQRRHLSRRHLTLRLNPRCRGALHAPDRQCKCNWQVNRWKTGQAGRRAGRRTQQNMHKSEAACASIIPATSLPCASSGGPPLTHRWQAWLQRQQVPQRCHHSLALVLPEGQAGGEGRRWGRGARTHTQTHVRVHACGKRGSMGSELAGSQMEMLKMK